MPASETDHPILFCPDMVKANHAGLKSVTRRLQGLGKINADPDAYTYLGMRANARHPDRWYALFADEDGAVTRVKSPWGNTGHTVYVRETHWRRGCWVPVPGATKTGKPRKTFKPTNELVRFADIYQEEGWHKRPGIFLPRELSRTRYGVLSVRAERLQKITWQDALAEGIKAEYCCNGIDCNCRGLPIDDPVLDFQALWNSLNAARGYPWSGNWWVWRLEYDNPKCTEATCRSK